MPGNGAPLRFATAGLRIRGTDGFKDTLLIAFTRVAEERQRVFFFFLRAGSMKRGATRRDVNVRVSLSMGFLSFLKLRPPGGSDIPSSLTPVGGR